MKEIITKTEYFGKKKALFEAIRTFCELNHKSCFVHIKSNESKQKIVEFSRKNIEQELGFELYNNLEKFILETLPKSENKPEGKLYHKDNILRIFKKSLI